MRRSILLAAALAIATIPASAISLGPVVETWNFSGVCTDCPGNGTGVLTVHQSQANGPLSFQFTYSSAWIAYTMTNAAFSIDGNPFTGTTFAIPTTGYFRFDQEVPITSFGGTGNPLSTPGVYNDGVISFISIPPSGTGIPAHRPSLPTMEPTEPGRRPPITMRFRNPPA